MDIKAYIVENIGYFGWFVATFIFASFVEYWLHRLMHFFPRTFGKVHVEHHRENTGQGFWLELRNYVVGTSPMMANTFVMGWRIGVCCTLGGITYAIFAAYAHQLQHDNPVKCDWMEMPVHYVHHKYNQWHHNFGLAVDWWDRVFGTYQPQEWYTEVEKNMPKQGYWAIKWL